MKIALNKMIVLALLVMPAVGMAKTVELTAELDRPVILADTEQTVYLRVGLRGCPVEILEERAPVNVAIVIDKSGSMNSGGKIQAAKEAAILALHRLKSNDIVSVVLYDSNVEVLVPATKMTDRHRIIQKIRGIGAGGSTALYAGVQTGAEEVRKFLSSKRVNRIVLLSDGLANVGPDSPHALGKLGADLIDESISVTTIGLGHGYNEDLMSQLAFKSDGGHYFCEEPDELAGIFDQEFGRSLSVVAQKVIIEITCPKGIKPVRLLGREGTIKGQKVMLDMNHIYSEHEKYALLEVQTNTYEKDALNIADVSIRYVDMKNNAEEKQSARIAATTTRSREVYDTRQNKGVYADVVEQIAIENNERALALRDQGQIDEAQKVLMQNSSYLRSNAAALSSPKLDSYAYENEKDADAVKQEDWSGQRKAMRESQSVRKTQR
ncbi:MAG: VWA domain-containing protein [Phycisphaerae bacterium]|nr:VWA domain-containing protein [Phycisphaerae bacterium]